MIRQIVAGVLFRIADLVLPEKPDYPPALDVLNEHTDLLEKQLCRLSERVAALELKQKRDSMVVVKGGEA